MDQPYNGARLDERPEELKQKDYQFGEIVASVNPVSWTNKPRSQWRKFPIYNQDGSGSCVAQTMAKLLGIMYALKNNGDYVHFSATDIYQRRVNRPDSGMGGDDVFRIATNGVTLEELVPSQNMNDQQMDSVPIPQYKKDVGSVFKIAKNWVNAPTGDIDTVASIIQTTQKGVMVWFCFEYREWTDVPKVLNPDVPLRGANTNRHSLPAVDFFICDQSNMPEYPETWGKKAILVDESWGVNVTKFQSQRVITEDFFKARNFFTAYPLNFAFEAPAPTPTPTPSNTLLPATIRYQFMNEMKFIPWSSITNQPADIATHLRQKKDVTAYQTILKYLGLFPANTAATGYYGAVTANATLKFCTKYGITPADQGRTADINVIKQLNKLSGINL